MSDDLVLYEVRRSAAVLTLNRPDRRNALSRGLIAALSDAVECAAADVAVRCLILTGAGSTFCAGMDLVELHESMSARPEDSPLWDDAQRLGELFDRIYALPKPTIAAINGPAVAGGAGLVTVCDLAVATPEAKLGYPGVRRGLVAALVMPHLLRHVGERLARYLLLTGEMIGGEEAQRAGLINAVVPADRLMDRASTWSHSVADGGPEAIRRTKELLNQFSHQALSVEEAVRASAAPRLTEECRQGLEAFFAKRPTPWSPA